ncbi:MAG: hypothetical protein JWO11_4099 [Nocardioides sp.]|nr:hypothetical protein [Nocardioides sp.]
MAPAAGESVAEARMREGADANKVLAELERMDADSAEFDQSETPSRRQQAEPPHAAVQQSRSV